MNTLLVLATACCCALTSTSNALSSTKEPLQRIAQPSKNNNAPFGWTFYSYRFFGEEIQVLFPCEPEMSSSGDEPILFCLDSYRDSFFMITMKQHDDRFADELKDLDAVAADVLEELEQNHQLVSCDVWNEEGILVTEAVIWMGPQTYLKMRIYITACNTFTLCTVDTTTKNSEATCRFLGSFRVGNI